MSTGSAYERLGSGRCLTRGSLLGLEMSSMFWSRLCLSRLQERLGLTHKYCVARSIQFELYQDFWCL